MLHVIVIMPCYFSLYNTPGLLYVLRDKTTGLQKHQKSRNGLTDLLFVLAINVKQRQ